MKTYPVSPEGLLLVLRLRQERDHFQARADALQRAYSESLEALQNESVERLHKTIEKLLINEGLDPEQWRQYSVDMNYLDHGYAFLRSSEESAPADPVSDFFAQFASTTPDQRH